jgi:hypothetical protein
MASVSDVSILNILPSSPAHRRLHAKSANEIPRTERFGISAAGSRCAHARKAPQVKPRMADCTARESVWESFGFTSG